VSTPPTLKQQLGSWLHERWRTELVLRMPAVAGPLGLTWLDLCNRNEKLRHDAVSGGRICAWQHSSRLTVARIHPPVAKRLLAHVLAEWPLQFNQQARSVASGAPKVSILIPMGGSGRLPQFDLALQSARAQSLEALEIIVVEQSAQPILAERLPVDVRYVHQPSIAGAGFNKSSALNAAARAARGEFLIILDADYLLPTGFASECARVLAMAEAVRPARWIFYLDEASTASLSTTQDWRVVEGIEHVVSNNPTPLALRRSTYWDIGGHDESYVGWGGEDTEFLDRLRTRSISEGGWMPVLHAWHAPAAKKASGDRNRDFDMQKMAVSATARIDRLRALQPERAAA